MTIYLSSAPRRHRTATDTEPARIRTSARCHSVLAAQRPCYGCRWSRPREHRCSTPRPWPRHHVDAGRQRIGIQVDPTTADTATHGRGGPERSEVRHIEPAAPARGVGRLGRADGAQRPARERLSASHPGAQQPRRGDSRDDADKRDDDEQLDEGETRVGVGPDGPTPLWPNQLGETRVLLDGVLCSHLQIRQVRWQLQRDL